MCKDSEKDCNTCRHNPGCLKKGLAVFLLFIQTGRDRELSRDPDGHLKTAFRCRDWEGESAMSYTGGGPYYAQQYPEYNGILWNGRCGNPECIYHWHPPEDAPAEPSHKEGSSG